MVSPASASLASMGGGASRPSNAQMSRRTRSAMKTFASRFARARASRLCCLPLLTASRSRRARSASARDAYLASIANGAVWRGAFGATEAAAWPTSAPSLTRLRKSARAPVSRPAAAVGFKAAALRSAAFASNLFFGLSRPVTDSQEARYGSGSLSSRGSSGMTWNSAKRAALSRADGSVAKAAVGQKVRSCSDPGFFLSGRMQR
mmetsp:Transcript_18569/g.66080  ORF Transcript_18569/g.66080 Transcript_18569/m.66080 type:complete len:205 (-) Transcript_18569:269-883(-)